MLNAERQPGDNHTPSDQGQFWDKRFLNEGCIWGERPSPTAQILLEHIAKRHSTLEIGFGYGRDMQFLAGCGHRVNGIDLSAAGRNLTEQRLAKHGNWAEQIWTGRFEETDFQDLEFDAALSHRMLHLVIDPSALNRFSAKLSDIIRPEGIICIGARDLRDIDPESMTPILDGVYEYTDRPGHRIRFWSDAMFSEYFGKDFEIIELKQCTEIEAAERPLPCKLTVMVARKRAAGS